MRILVVSDSDALRDIAAEILGGAGFDAVEGIGAAEAPARLGLGVGEPPADPAPDLVLMDLTMAETDGVELCARLKADTARADVPVVLFATLVELDLLPQAFAAGAHDYVMKPVRPAELLARARAALRLKQEVDRRTARERALARVLADRRPPPRPAGFDRTTAMADLGVMLSHMQARPFGAVVMAQVDGWSGYVARVGAEQAQQAFTQIADAVRGAEARLGDLVTLIEPGALAVHVVNGERAVAVANQIGFRVSRIAIPSGSAPDAPPLSVSVAIVDASGDPLARIEHARRSLGMAGTLTDTRPPAA